MSRVLPLVIFSLTFGFAIEGFDALVDGKGLFGLTEDEGFSVVEALAAAVAFGVLGTGLSIVDRRFRRSRAHR